MDADASRSTSMQPSSSGAGRPSICHRAGSFASSRVSNDPCAERPITCREYLVTSPAEYCAQPGSKGVRRVKLPLQVFNAVARWQVPPLEHIFERWVPLILAPEWADAHPDDPPPKPGVELLRDLLDHLHDGQGDAASHE